MPHPRYSSAEIVQRGQVLYDQQIRAHVEASHPGKFLVLDIETGDYEIDADDVAALQRAKAKHPDAAFYILRVGTPTAYRLGGRGWTHVHDYGRRDSLSRSGGPGDSPWAAQP
jgi:hypothetical protein